ncbi:hypothetical protein BKA81DRAFT_353834 [Phyllosticta paracitricarpa]
MPRRLGLLSARRRFPGVHKCSSNQQTLRLPRRQSPHQRQHILTHTHSRYPLTSRHQYGGSRQSSESTPASWRRDVQATNTLPDRPHESFCAQVGGRRCVVAAR